MQRERHIVGLYSGGKAMMSQSVFLADSRRVEESRVGDEVCEEAEDVDEGEIDGCAAR